MQNNSNRQAFSVVVDHGAIPTELKGLRCWVMWRQESRGGKATKVPYRGGGRKAWTTNSSHWMLHSQVESLSRGHRTIGSHEGIGFVFHKEGPYLGIDLDNCIDSSGVVAPWAQAIIDRLDTYTEVSPSGRGVKLICRARKPGRARSRPASQPGVEIYDCARFFTITGNRLPGTPATVRGCQPEIDQLCADWWPEQPTNRMAARREPMVAVDASDRDIIDRASRCVVGGERFRGLWAGSLAGHGGNHSSADLALCGQLAWWVGPDPARTDALFRLSGLMREKWERSDYRDRTIERAIAGRYKFYDWRKLEKPVRVIASGKSPSDKSDNHDPATNCTAPLRGYFVGLGAKADKRLWGQHRCGQCEGCHRHWQETLVTTYCTGDAPTLKQAEKLHVGEIAADDRQAVLKAITRQGRSGVPANYLTIQHQRTSLDETITVIATVPFVGSREVQSAEGCQLAAERFRAIERDQRGNKQRPYATSRGWKMPPKEREYKLLGRATKDRPVDDHDVRKKLQEMGATGIATTTREGMTMVAASVPQAFNDEGFMTATGITPAWQLRPPKPSVRPRERHGVDYGAAAVRAKEQR